MRLEEHFYLPMMFPLSKSWHFTSALCVLVLPIWTFKDKPTLRAVVEGFKVGKRSVPSGHIPSGREMFALYGAYGASLMNYNKGTSQEIFTHKAFTLRADATLNRNESRPWCAKSYIQCVLSARQRLKSKLIPEGDLDRSSASTLANNMLSISRRLILMVPASKRSL